YLTSHKEGAKGEGKIFASPEEVRMAYHEGDVALHAMVHVRMKNGERIETTPGRILSNEILPEEMGYYNETVVRSALGRLVDGLYRRFGSTKTAEVLDDIKRIGFEYATRSGTTVSVADVAIPPEKKEILAKAEEQVAQVEEQHRRGLLTHDERYQRICDI